MKRALWQDAWSLQQVRLLLLCWCLCERVVRLWKKVRVRLWFSAWAKRNRQHCVHTGYCQGSKTSFDLCKILESRLLFNSWQCGCFILDGSEISSPWTIGPIGSAMCGCASPVVERQGVRWRPDHADASCPSYGSVDYWIRHHRPICCLFRSTKRDVLFSMDLSPIRRPDRQRRQRPSNHRPVVASIAQLQLYLLSTSLVCSWLISYLLTPFQK